MLILFVVIFLANSLTLAVTITAAIKRPILTNMLIGGVALCATLFALQQLVTGQGNPFALLCTVLLIIMLARSRVIWRSKKR